MRANEENVETEIYEETEGKLYATNAVADPVLAELWDNEKDAEYDRI
jgi:hypothetical protein